MLWIWLGFGILSAIIYSAKVTNADWNLLLGLLLLVSGPLGLFAQSIFWAVKK